MTDFWEGIGETENKSDFWEGVGKTPHVEVTLDYNPPEEQSGVISKLAGGFAEMALPSTTPSDYLQGPVLAAKNPSLLIDSLKQMGHGLISAHTDRLQNAHDALKTALNSSLPTEDRALAAAEALRQFLSATPVVGPLTSSIGEHFGEGEIARGIGNLAGLTLPFGIKGVSKLAGKAGQAVSPGLRASAETDYAKMIRPTIKEAKTLTAEKIAPGLAERKIFAMSRKGLSERAGQEAEAAGQALENAYSIQAPGSTVKVSPVLKAIEKLKDENIVGGQIVDEGRNAALSKVQEIVKGVAGSSKGSAFYPEVSLDQARKLRQIFDRMTREKTRIFKTSGMEADSLYASKQVGNALREQMAKEFPDIAELNKEFSFWQTAQEVLDETITRTASQSQPMGQQIMRAGGVAAGLATGGIAKAGMMGEALAALRRLMTSTPYYTLKGMTKAKLVFMLQTGQYPKIIKLVKELESGSKISVPLSEKSVQGGLSE